MKKSIRVICGVVAGCLAGLCRAEAPAKIPPPLAAGVQSHYDTETATVEKVFAATDGEHRFVAYQVTWQGAEVIVSDTLARSDFKVGDTITFLSQRIAMTAPPADVSSLSFTLVEAPKSANFGVEAGGAPTAPAEQDRLIKLVQGDLSVATSERERFYALGKAARKALKEGKTEEAFELAAELERLARNYKDDWNYGNAVQDSNQVLGRIALAEGDVAEARKRLLASADSKGSPQMNSFGPNMQLAKDLLEQGEGEVVLEYFERCGTFWKMGTDRLAAWKQTVEQGEIPAFGASLDY